MNIRRRIALPVAVLVLLASCLLAAGEKPERFDPTPVESVQGPETGTKAVASKEHPRQVKSFKKGKDPFKNLSAPEVPKLDEGDPRADTLRLGPKPLPEPGEVAEAFPPSGDAGPPPQVKVRPLKIVRHSPEGAVDLVERITASFSQPMVPLGSLPMLDRIDAPMSVTPELPGRFLWLGTDTVAFEGEKRLPLATRFEVAVPAGATSVLGERLEEGFSWSFETARPTVTSTHPYNNATGLELDITLTIDFNTLVDAEQILKWVRLRDGEGKKIRLESQLQKVTRDGKEELLRVATRVNLKPKKKLSPATTYELVVRKGLISAEGPLASLHRQKFKFKTYEPLRVDKISCHWGEKCPAGYPITVEFNNELVDQKVKHLVSVKPEPKDLTIERNWRSVVLRGAFLPSTSYKVRVKKGFKDKYEQVSRKGAKQTLEYGPLPPLVKFTRDGRLVMEADQSKDLDIISMNVKTARVKIAAVPLELLPDVPWRAGRWYDDDDDAMKLLKPVVDERITLEKEPNRVSITPVSLKPALSKAGLGFVFIELRPRRTRKEDKDNWFRPMAAFVQVTDLGLTVAESGDDVLVRVAGLKDGLPVAGVKVILYDHDMKELRSATTDAMGAVFLEKPLPGSGGSAGYVVADKDGDRSFIRLNGYNTHRPERNPKLKPAYLGYLFSDRGVYRPGEEVSLTFVARARSRGPDGDLIALPPAARKFSYRVEDPRGGKLAEGKIELSHFGVGSLKVTPPGDAAVGWYHVYLENEYGSFGGNFQVEEYRVPEYRVEAEWLHGGSNILIWRELEAKVKASYFFGAPLAGAEVNWNLKRIAAFYHPPGNPGFTFSNIGQARFWRWHEHHWRHGPRYQQVKSGRGKLDAAGVLHLPLTLDPGGYSLEPVTFTLEANVFDENRQAIAGRASIVAHRAERYVGLAVDRSVVEAGESLGISAVVTRLDGSRYDEATASVRLLKAYNKRIKLDPDPSGEDRYTEQYTEDEVGKCELKAGKAAGTCRLTVPEAGVYLVRAKTLDKAGRPALSAVQIRAYGAGEASWKPDPENRVSFLTDKEEYEPGDVAKVLVQSPFKDAIGIAAVSREGFVTVEPLDVKDGMATFEVAIEEHFVPGVQVSVVLARGRISEPGKSADDPGKPAFADGYQTLKVSSLKRKVFLKLTPSAKAVEPGGTFTLALAATDWNGKPVKANIALMVVDEGVLSLISYITPDPLKVLYRVVSSATALQDLRRDILARIRPKFEFDSEEEAQKQGEAMPAVMELAAPKLAPEKSAGPRRSKKGKDSGGGDGPEFALREVFKSTAYFNSGLKTDGKGRLKVDIRMPDNTTEFRVMAIAADEAKMFGSADVQVRTRKTLIVRPSLPRFLNYGDTFRASAVVNNQTGYDTEVWVRCLAANAIVEEPLVKVFSPAGKAVEVSFPARAGSPGPATFQFAAVALTKNRDTDAAQVTIPTLIPATSEAFAMYGVVDDAIRQPLIPPKDALPQFGGLDVSLSSTALTGLQDATTYLFEYSYECTEQVCSRILPILALGDILTDFKLGGVETPDEARTLVRRGLKKILDRQRSDGGWGSWSGSSNSWLYLTAYATMTLQWAKRKGFEVPDYPLSRARDFLRQRLDKPYEWEEHAYGAQAMAVLVLTRFGEKPTKHLERLFKIATEDKPGRRAGTDYPMTIYAKAWLLEGLWRVNKDDSRVGEIYRRIENSAVETPSAIHFAEGAHEGLKLMMHTSDRTDAIVLGALLAVKPDSPLIDKLVRGLSRSRVDGRWSTTQANAYALLGMAEYYRLFEPDEPDFEARLWFGNTYVAGREFTGRDMTISKTRVPMKALLKKAAGDLVLAKTGKGRLYYRLGLKYAPTNLDLEPEDRGFSVSRVYLPVGDSGDLRQERGGTWVAKAGSYVLVRVQVIAPDRRYYVAVVDPLPAGLEPVNERFATSSQAATSGKSSHRWWWWSPWEHEEKRDDRIQLFRDRLYGGVYEYTYVARATTIGSFVAPPARAEEMYNPETFGRSGTDRFRIVD